MRGMAHGLQITIQRACNNLLVKHSLVQVQLMEVAMDLRTEGVYQDLMYREEVTDQQAGATLESALQVVHMDIQTF